MPLIYSPKYFTQASKKYLVNMPNRLPSKYFVQSTFKCFIFLLIAISFTKNTFAQNPKTEICNNLSISFNKNIQNQNYTEAAKIWDQREKAKCTFTEIDYYNAACIYSTKNEQALALKYLRLSINNDYEDTAHMAIDKDLNNIRNADGYKKLILLIQNKKIQKAKEEALQEKNRKINDWKNQFDNKQKQKWQFLKQYFVKIDLKKLKELIPYYLGDYWGYMNKSGVALTKPIFQFTDFYSMHGLLFKYQNEYFFTQIMEI